MREKIKKRLNGENPIIRTTITSWIVVAYTLIPALYGAVMWYFESFANAQFDTMFNSWLETYKYVIVTVVAFYFANKQQPETQPDKEAGIPEEPKALEPKQQ